MPEGRMFGYVRVSSKDQNEARQIKEMQEMGIEERDIYIDKQSGKNFVRERYLVLRDHVLREGDVLVIKSISRFGRNYREILNEWRYITKEVGAYIVVQEMPLLDTRRDRDLLGTLIADIVISVLSYAAENERENIRLSQREGIDIALANGVHFGRRALEYPDRWEEVYAEWTAGKMTAVAAYSQLGLPKSSFYKLAARYKQEHPSSETTP